MAKKRILALLLLMGVMVITSCSQESPSDKTQPSANVITVPVDIVGEPDRIYMVKDQAETIYEQGSSEFGDYLESTKARFPEGLKEAATALTWKKDDGSFDWKLMSEDFDYIRFHYDDAQNVKLDCYETADYPKQELSYNDLTFPLSEELGELFIVGTARTYGVLKPAE